MRDPSRTTPPPIQIQTIIGDTTTRNAAGGGLRRYDSTSAARTTACICGGALENLLLATVIGCIRREVSGWTAVQTSPPRPQRTSVSLVDSPVKKRPNAPPDPSVAS